MQIQPYLHFDGRTEEALKFYEARLGAKIGMMLRFSDAPKGAMPEAGSPGGPPAGSMNKVMHASFSIGDTQLMASDGMCGSHAEFKGMSLTITAPTEAEAERLFAAVTSDGGQVQMPMSETFFAGRFGVGTDKFGVNWMVLGKPKQP
jgi:PhnB protein